VTRANGLLAMLCVPLSRKLHRRSRVCGQSDGPLRAASPDRTRGTMWPDWAEPLSVIAGTMRVSYAGLCAMCLPKGCTQPFAEAVGQRISSGPRACFGGKLSPHYMRDALRRWLTATSCLIDGSVPQVGACLPCCVKAQMRGRRSHLRSICRRYGSACASENIGVIVKPDAIETVPEWSLKSVASIKLVPPQEGF
jgi:hypothetical protein